MASISYGQNLNGVQKGTTVTVNNKGSHYFKLDRSNSWSGNPIEDKIPEIVPAQGAIKFTHLTGKNGSIGAVQYSGHNKAGLECAIIVAWDAPSVYNPPNFPNKVYTSNGPKDIIDGETWEATLRKMEKASSSTAAFAKIDHQDPDTANVVVDVSMDDWYPSGKAS